MNETTIAAISTFQAESAIGVIRISGPDTFNILSKVLSPLDVSTAEPRRVYLCRVRDNGRELDRPLVTFFRSPHSYTGEDMAELSCHGNPYILSRVLNLLVGNGACPAQAGEFTRRAFMNGKMDLSQAEAVADIISAKNDGALDLALKQLDGAEKDAIIHLKNSLSELITSLELEIDFAHEDTMKTTHSRAAEELRLIIGQVRALISNADEGILIKEGVKTVITGRPNTGKSSIMNALLKKNRAIVTQIAGTTRDVIEDSLSIDSLSFRLFDTAGIRRSINPVEEEGIKRAREAMAAASLVIFVLDGSVPLSDGDAQLYSEISGKNVIILLNKSDLTAAVTPQQAAQFLGSKDAPVLSVSSLDYGTIIPLTNLMKNTIIKKGSNAAPGDVLIASLRHKQALIMALQSLEAAETSLRQEMSFEFAAADLNTAAARLSEITGEISNEDVLESIFGRFCIGK